MTQSGYRPRSTLQRANLALAAEGALADADVSRPIRFVYPKPRIKRLRRCGFLGRLIYLDHRFLVELARRRYHQTWRPCCTRAKLINGAFENARFGIGLNFHVIRQAGEGQLKFINACRDISE
jgi:hypothetical protein